MKKATVDIDTDPEALPSSEVSDCRSFFVFRPMYVLSLQFSPMLPLAVSTLSVELLHRARQIVKRN